MQKAYPDNTAVNYTYDNDSRLIQVSDPTGTYQFTFDNMGRLMQATTSYTFLTGRNFTAANVSDLSNAHLGENATIALLGCFAGSGGDLSIAQMIANQLHRNVTAFPNSAFFGGAKCPKNSHPRDRAPSKVPVRVCQQGGAGPLTFYPKR